MQTASGPGATDASAIHPAPTKSPLDLSDWKLEDDLREAQRLVRQIQLQCDEPEGVFDACEAAPPSDDQDRRERSAAPTARQARAGSSSLLGWLVLGCGLSGLVCGCALLVWSHYSGRGELWNIGLPVAIVSQAVLMCGIILQQGDRRRAAQESEPESPPQPAAATHLHVNTGPALRASGLSVHFSTSPQQQAAPTSRQIKQQVDAALRRRAA